MKQASSAQPGNLHPVPNRRRFAASSLLLALSLLVATPQHVAACSFHVSLSGNTLSRQIADSVELVAMRPSEQNPFQFEAVEQLKGIRSDSIPPHLVDSSTRRQLAANVNHAVLFARGSDGQWTRLMLLDEDRRRIAQELLANSSSWASPGGAAGKRDYFAALLSHPATDVQHLALRELDAMSYEVLRDGTYPLTADELLSGIVDLQSMAFAPIKILVLGIMGGRDAEQAILDRLEGLAVSGSSLNLGAWISAGIEAAGLHGIDKFEREFLNLERALSDTQLLEIVRALSVQSTSGKPELRTALDDTIRRIVGQYPEAGPMIAQVFAQASDWSQVGLVRDLIATDAFPKRSDLMAAVAYVSRYGQPERSRRHPLLRTDMRFKSPPSSP